MYLHFVLLRFGVIRLHDIYVYVYLCVLQTLTVLNPFRSAEAAAMQDTDFAGPLVFCLTFGAFLLLVK